MNDRDNIIARIREQIHYSPTEDEIAQVIALLGAIEPVAVDDSIFEMPAIVYLPSRPPPE